MNLALVSLALLLFSPNVVFAESEIYEHLIKAPSGEGIILKLDKTRMIRDSDGRIHAFLLEDAVIPTSFGPMTVKSGNIYREVYLLSVGNYSERIESYEFQNPRPTGKDIEADFSILGRRFFGRLNYIIFEKSTFAVRFISPVDAISPITYTALKDTLEIIPSMFYSDGSILFGNLTCKVYSTSQCGQRITIQKKQVNSGHVGFYPNRSVRFFMPLERFEIVNSWTGSRKIYLPNREIYVKENGIISYQNIAESF